MKFFWPIYFLTAVAGTAGVYLTAPLARPYVETVLGKREKALTPDVPQGRGAPDAPASKTADPPLPEAWESAPPRAAPGDDDDVSAPAMNGIYLATRNDKPGWGITARRATCYGLDGARLGHVPGGVLLDYKDARVSSIGDMVECVLRESGTPSAPRLVSRKEVLLFTGSYTKLSAKQRADLQAYYALSGKVSLRKTELLQAAAAANPFFATYNQAYKAYMTHIEEAKALTGKRDRATGLDKSRLEDQLREMKVAETSLRAQYDATHEKFRAWKDQHTNEIAKAENDPDVLKWTLEMQALRSSVPGLAL